MSLHWNHGNHGLIRRLHLGFQLHSSHASICWFYICRTIYRPTVQQYTIHVHDPAHPGIFLFFWWCFLSLHSFWQRIAVIYLAAQYDVLPPALLLGSRCPQRRFWRGPDQSLQKAGAEVSPGQEPGREHLSMSMSRVSPSGLESVLSENNTLAIPLKNPQDLSTWNYQAFVLKGLGLHSCLGTEGYCFSLAMVSIIFFGVWTAGSFFGRGFQENHAGRAVECNGAAPLGSSLSLVVCSF